MSISNRVIYFSHRLEFLGQCLNLFIELLFFVRGFLLRISQIKMELLILRLKFVTDSLHLTLVTTLSCFGDFQFMLQIGVFVLKLVDTVFVFFTLSNELIVLGVKTLDLLTKLAILLFELCCTSLMLIRCFFVNSQIVLELKMSIL